MVEGSDLVFSFDYGSQGAENSSVEMQVMGYRGDRPFAQMPKIRVKVKGADYQVSDRKQRLPNESIRVTDSPGTTEVRVPLDLLGNPERIHFNAAIKPAKGPLDPMPWVAITLPD